MLLKELVRFLFCCDQVAPWRKFVLILGLAG